MNIKDFIDGFLKSKKKANYLVEHIKDIYIPYEKKMTICDKVVKATTEVQVDENKKIYKEDSVTRNLLYSIQLIDLYTDIDGLFENITESYNLLAENKILKILLSSLPRDEIEEFDAILEMTLNDFHENYRTIPSWLSTKFEAIELLFHGYEDALKKLADDYVNSGE